jgi:hypothetical protein
MGRTNVPYSVSLQLIGSAVCTFLFTAAWGLLASPAACAQERQFKVLFGETKDPANAKEFLLLRPAKQKLFVFVENLAKAPYKKVVVGVVHGAAKFESSPTSVDPGKRELLTFPKPAMAVDESKLSPNPITTPLKLQTNADGKDYADVVNVQFKWPWDYVEPPIVTYNGVDRRLEVKFPGPSSAHEVRLDKLSPDAIDGLVDLEKIEYIARSPVSENGQATLEAKNLAFDKPNPTGLIYVAVDNYERAFIFKLTFGPGRTNSGEAVNDQQLRLVCPKYSLPTLYSVRLEADRANPDYTLEVAFDRTGGNVFGEKKSFVGPRKQLLRFGPPDDDGAIALNMLTEDWQAEYDFKGIKGAEERHFRGLLKDGDTVKSTAFASVIVDEERPQIALTPPPKLPLTRGETIRLEAKASAASSIKGVYFFEGPPPDDRNKLPANVIRANWIKEDNNWQAKIKLPADRDSITFTAAAVNGVDLIGFSDRVEIPLVKPEVVVAQQEKPKQINVTGTVFRGSIAQPKLDVELRDAKGKTLKTATTDRSGKFKFEDVPPGTYQVYCRNKKSNSEDQKSVTVEAGKDPTPVALKLIVRR